MINIKFRKQDGSFKAKFVLRTEYWNNNAVFNKVR